MGGTLDSVEAIAYLPWVRGAVKWPIKRRLIAAEFASWNPER